MSVEYAATPLAQTVPRQKEFDAFRCLVLPLPDGGVSRTLDGESADHLVGNQPVHRVTADAESSDHLADVTVSARAFWRRRSMMP
jgi:hypothetical protein